MRIVLKIADGPYDGRTVLLQTGQKVKVGRTEWADFSVPHDDRISGVHFAIECERQRCVVRDLDSTNGTTVNGEIVTESELQDGDVIVAGRTRFDVTVEITESVFDLDAITAEASAPTEADSVDTHDDELSDEIAEPLPTPSQSSEPSTIVPGPVVSDTPSRHSFDAAALLTAVDKPSVTSALLLVPESEQPYPAALADPDPDARHAALMAAAWSGERWLLEYCRSLASEPQTEHWDALQMLAILGEPSDLERIIKVGRTVDLGSCRFELYASFGHPRVVRDLLIELESDDENTAVAAGIAFMKITGADIDSEDRVELQPEDGSEPDDFEKEFLDEAFLPDPELAKKHWSRVKDDFAEGTRWRRGLNLSSRGGLDVLDQLDMEARWEVCLRATYEGYANVQGLTRPRLAGGAQ